MERLRRALELNAFIAITSEGAPGIPAVAVEDVIDVAGLATTCGAPLVRSPAVRDAAVVARVRASGAAIVGKANLEPWTFGVTSANPWWGDVRHPTDPTRVPGGSSGGAAVAVATLACDWAIGADTGGSVRIPAALCGVVGVKPSHGSVVMDGVAPLAPSLDTLGVFARDLATAARALAIVAGRPEWADAVALGAPSPRLGIPAGWVDGLDEEVGRAWSRVVTGMRQLVLPDRKIMSRTAMTLLLHEAAAVHRETLQAHPEAFPPPMARALARGRGIPEAEVCAARQAQWILREEVARAMEGVDALVLPTCERVAPRRNDGVAAASLTRFTMPFNLTGQPALTIPVPTSGLPVGIQLVGRVGDEVGLLRAAAALVESLG